MEENIYQKLADFKQKEIKLEKNKKGFNYTYATLGQIQEKISPIFKELGLVIFHRVELDCVITEIRHIESNTFVSSSIEIGKVYSERKESYIDEKGKKNIQVDTFEYNDKDPQGVGSVLTYYRRYNLLLLLDLEVEEDDDGQKGSNKYKNKASRPDESIYEMLASDIEKWNGKIYGGDSIYLDNEKKRISNEQINKLKKHAKYIPNQ